MLKQTEIPHEISSLMMKLNAAKEIGFNMDFEYEDGGLKCMQTGKVYQQDEVKIVDHFRFEGISDPDDMSILYLVVANDGDKGVIVDAFGTYGNSELFEFLKGVPDETRDHL